MAQYTEYHPLKFWLDPASIAEIVAHIQKYLVDNPINSTTEIETIIHDYLIAHPELIGGVESVNGETGEVVLTADNISGGENVTIKDVLDSLQDQIDDIVASIPSDYQQLIDDVSDLKSAIDYGTVPIGELVPNIYITATGTEAPYSGWSATDFIRVYEDVRVLNIISPQGNGGSYDAFYDSDKVFISNFDIGAGENSIAIPDGAVYFRLSNTTSSLTNTEIKWWGAIIGVQVGEVNDNLKSYIYGINKHFQVTGGGINRFNMLLLEGIKYTVTNNTGVSTNVILFKKDGAKSVVATQLANGASISFVVDSDEYTQIGGFVNANPSGTFDVVCEYSDLENGKKIILVDELLTKVTRNIDANITEKVTKHENQFYNVNNTVYAGGNQWNYYTFSVSEGDAFTIDTVAGGTIRGWAFRDASENQLSIASYDGDVIQKEYTDVIAPANAVELIVNFKHVSGYLTIIKNGEVVLNENRIYYNGIELPKYLDKINALAEEKFNILHGKVLCCCGDSITYGADMTEDELVTPEIESYQYSAYTKKWTRWTADEPAAYGYQIAARNGMIFYNGGVSGACVQGSGGTSTVPGFSVADGEYTLLPDNIDYLTLFFGWNDTATGSLGTISDTTNDSYYGGYNVVLPYLINKYPYTKIALIVPFGTDVGHRQAIRDLANKWGLACFDMYKEGTPLYWGKEPDIDVGPAIITANREKFWAQPNSPHPNYHGHYQIGTMLEHFLRGI